MEEKKEQGEAFLKIIGKAVHHKHGIDLLLGTTDEEVFDKLYKYVQEWWSDLRGENIPEKPPEDRTTAIEMYFSPDNWGLGDEEFIEEIEDVVSLYDAAARITSDRLDGDLRLKFTKEGLIADIISGRGEVTKTMSMMWDEFVESLLR